MHTIDSIQYHLDRVRLLKTPSDLPPSTKSVTPTKRMLVMAARIFVTALVLIAVGWSFHKSLGELSHHKFQIRQTRFEWLLGTALLYVLGNFSSCWYWRIVLRAMHQRVTNLSCLQAYCIGQLGKYIPGKAAVLVLRAGLLRGERVNLAVTTASIFVETLTMMAVGACLAAVVLVFIKRDDPLLIWLSVALMGCAGLPTLPPLFRWAIGQMKVVRLNLDAMREIQSLDWRVIGEGWLISSLTWLCFGGSLWCTLHALPGLHPQAADFPLCTACIALATVAGFVSFLPGGLGVREAVLVPMLASFGAGNAIIAAIGLRLVWLLTEFVLAIILYVVGIRQPMLAERSTSTIKTS